VSSAPGPYLAITDHSQRLALTHGLDAAPLAKQIDRIDQANAGLKGSTLLRGIEVDLLASAGRAAGS
jgi:DNA polymerase (family 10)